MRDESSGASRRSVLAGAAGVATAAGVAVALGGCQTYGTENNRPPAGGGQPPAGSGATGGASANLGAVADIPVGGGKIFETEGVVVTQPQAGTIKAFSAVCTHQGCTVAAVREGTINCPCHGSRFNVSDGSVANGPATAPLDPVKVTVTGGLIKLG